MKKFYAGRRVLVTGGAGFIGSHLVDSLVALGAETLVYDNLSNGEVSNINSGAELIVADINDDPSLEQAVAGVDLIFHLAAQINPALAVENPLLDAEVNLMGTVRLLVAASRAGVRKVVAASTNVYGDAHSATKWSESASILDLSQSLLSPYAAAKVGAEAYLKVFADEFGLGTVRLRFSNVYGERQTSKSGSGVIPIFTERAFCGQPLRLFGGGSQTRDFVHVSDVVRATVAAGLREEANGLAINVAAGREISVREIAHHIKVLVGVPLDILEGPDRAADFQSAAIDTARARQVLDWAPEVTIEDGLAQYVAWWRNQPFDVTSQFLAAD